MHCVHGVNDSTLDRGSGGKGLIPFGHPNVPRRIIENVAWLLITEPTLK